jgi:hypothetical protein
MNIPLVALFALALPLHAPTSAQEPQPPGKVEDPVAADVAKAIGSPRLAIRIAAGRKVAAAGDAAVPALRGHAEKAGANSIPLTLVEALVEGGSDGPEMCLLLREWARDREFFWRAQALRGLAIRASTSRTEDVELFRSALRDPAWLARANAALGLARTQAADEAGEPAWAVLLEDADPRVVSRAAALVLPMAPEQAVLQALVDALGDGRTFLGDPWGNRRCTEALAALRQWAADTSLEPRKFTPQTQLTWTPGAGLTGNRAAIDTVIGLAKRRMGTQLREPVELRDGDRVVDGGIEVSSCRNGFVVAGIDGSRAVKLDGAAWQQLRGRIEGTQLPSESGTVVCDRMRIARIGTRTQHAVAPATLPAADAAWVRELAAALARAGAADLAAALEDRLLQFTTP